MNAFTRQNLLVAVSRLTSPSVYYYVLKTTLNGKADVVQPFSISNFNNHPSLDKANLSKSQPKHSTIASIPIPSVLNCVFE